MCGGTRRRCRRRRQDEGLSPRVRGNLVLAPMRPSFPGSIPACAGEPSRSRPQRGDARVYPRVCGGTLQKSVCPGWVMGLSPRVRGNRRPLAPLRHRPGSIPACAGEPARTSFGWTSQKVYPRVCGGTHGRPDRNRNWSGLSPRVRGNPAYTHRFRAYPRSIPACAGEPPSSVLDEVLTEVYPACAGEPFDPFLCDRNEGVYPRVCGGTRKHSPAGSLLTGLSPRVRGNPGGTAVAGGQGRSIPACAGEPPTTKTTPAVEAVYPRVCGGTVFGHRFLKFVGGLSPRVRGNLV